MKKLMIAFVGLLVAAPVLADSGAGRTPAGDAASGAGRTLVAGWPTIVDPFGPDSGAGRNPLTGDATSGAGRSPVLAANIPVAHPNSGAGRNPLTGDATSGAGRALA